MFTKTQRRKVAVHPDRRVVCGVSVGRVGVYHAEYLADRILGSQAWALFPARGITLHKTLTLIHARAFAISINTFINIVYFVISIWSLHHRTGVIQSAGNYGHADPGQIRKC